MKPHAYVSNLTPTTSLTSRLAHSTTLRAILAGLLFVQAHSASALSFTRGTATSVGLEQFSSTPDSDTLTGAFTAASVITTGLSIPENRIQYDIITSDQVESLNSWTVSYSSSLGPDIIGAYTPLGYVNSSGTATVIGGNAFTTLFNKGYGLYNYNTGAPWSIDYEADHITFTALDTLPPGAGVGDLGPTPYLPSFAIEFSPNLGVGVVTASATAGTAGFTGTVLGPVVPEPSTALLLMAGVVGLAVRRHVSV
ncbi:MAG TPA: PEP-CTERM sorting domain-containing protein [Myxococcota bacterium]|nr:PEP-CTERM sorting domain-containing protein [Myxococcota bacterium]